MEEERGEGDACAPQEPAPHSHRGLRPVLSAWPDSGSPAVLASPRRLAGRPLAAPSRRVGGPPTSGRRESSAPAGNGPAAPAAAAALPDPTVLWGGRPSSSQRRLSARASSPRLSVQDEAISPSSVSSVLEQLEPRLGQTLQTRLTLLGEHVETARGHVREQSKQNAQLQRCIEEQKERVARISDFEGHNRIFSTRVSQDARMFECLPSLVARERLAWERCRLAAEDLAQERRLAGEAEAAALRERGRQAALAREARVAEAQLRWLGERAGELQRVHDDAAKKAIENRTLLRKIEKLRVGIPRWR